MKRIGLDHPKLFGLADAIEREFGLPGYCVVATATGLLERLWGFTAKHAPDGLVGEFTAAQVGRGIGWPQDPARLLAVLVTEGWLVETEEGLQVHGWSKHADRHVHRALIREGKTFADGSLPRRSYAKDKQEAAQWDAAWGHPRATPEVALEAASGVAPGADSRGAPGAPSQSVSVSQSEEPERERERTRPRDAARRQLRAIDVHASVSDSPDDEWVSERVEVIRQRLTDRSEDSRNLEAIVRALPWEWIEGLMFDAVGRRRETGVLNATAYFVSRARDLAEKNNVELGLKRRTKRAGPPTRDSVRQGARA